MKSTLLSILEAGAGNDTTLQKLVSAIPSKDQFVLLEHLLPVLQAVRAESEKLSADKIPTICEIIPSMYTLSCCIDKVTVIGSLLLF